MNKEFNLYALIRPSILALEPYSSARDEYTDLSDNMTFLDANENPFPSPVNRYPDPWQRSLKSILSEMKGVEVDSILLGNGSDEVLDLLVRAFCEPGTDNIITLPPTYGMYKVLSGINNVMNIEVPLTTDFEPNLLEIAEQQNSKSKLLFICAPNNPTGNTFSEESIMELLRNFSGVVVIDEAYIDFSEKDSWLKRLNDFPNLVITQTLSKAYGMAGIRLGICYASSEIISVLNKIKPPYNLNSLTQSYAVRRLLQTNSIKNEIRTLTRLKEELLKVLLQLKFVQHAFPSDTNFLLVRVDDANLRYQQLIEAGIVVRNRSSQHGCEHSLRITIGTPEENIKLINQLKIMQS